MQESPTTTKGFFSKDQRDLFLTVLRLPTLWVAALGYFVDLYDLVLFGAVRVESLRSLAIPEPEILSTGALLLNCQMAGLLVGGFFWGILGDKKGRLKVLYGSIALYSVAYFANAFVTSIPAYGLWRFLAGVGLAGELGGAVTLVSEAVPRSARSFGSTLIGLAGFLGALLAASVVNHISWRWSYASGGLLGILLLLVRIRSEDSHIFRRIQNPGVRRGDLRLLFKSVSLRRKFNLGILVGLPIWFVSGVLIYFAPEMGATLQLDAPVSAAQAIFWSYAGTILGDIITGLLSQYLRSRKRVILLCYGILMVAIYLYCFGLRGGTVEQFKAVCFLLGLGAGYWALYVLAIAEYFGTNLRSTVSTSIPNLVRGAAIPLVALFRWLSPSMGAPGAALWLGCICLGLAGWALSKLPESFHLDLDYIDHGD